VGSLIRTATIAGILVALSLPPIAAQQPEAMAVSLRNLPTRLPEFVLTQTRSNADSVVAYYVLAKEQTASGPPNALHISIDSFASVEAAERGRELSLHTTSVAPDHQSVYKGLTIYRWGQSGSQSRILCRTGTYVINVSALRPSAEPFIMKVLDSVIEDLTTGLR
jgi:hypothetical protein